MDTFDGDPVFNCLLNNNSDMTGGWIAWLGLAGWLPGCLVGCLAGLLVDCLGWAAAWLAGRLTALAYLFQPAGWPVGCSES